MLLVNTWYETIGKTLIKLAVRKYYKLCVAVGLGYPNWMEVDLLHHLGRWVRVEWTSHGVSRPKPHAQSVEIQN